MRDATTSTGPHSCLTWCNTDHVLEQAQRILDTASVEQYPEDNRERLDAVLGGPQPGPAVALPPETYLVHRCEVGVLQVAEHLTWS